MSTISVTVNSPTIAVTETADSIDVAVNDQAIEVLMDSAGIATDHGTLTGLADDDHTQYLLVDGTRSMTGHLTTVLGGGGKIVIGESSGLPAVMIYAAVADPYPSIVVGNGSLLMGDGAHVPDVRFLRASSGVWSMYGAKLSSIADGVASSDGAAFGQIAAAITALALGTASTLAYDTDGTAAANSDARLSTQKAMRTYVAAAVAALVASSPSTLDTLKELADALGDDPNYAATTAALIGAKLATSAAPELIRDTIGTALTQGANITITVDDGGDTITIAVSGLTSSSLSDFTEAVQDVMGALAAGGSGLTLTYNDGANTYVLDVNVDGNTLEINADALRVKDGGITATKLDSTTVTEFVQDVLGVLASGGSGLTMTYTDVSNTWVLDVNVDGTTIEVSADTLRVKDRSIGSAKLAGLTVNAYNGTGHTFDTTDTDCMVTGTNALAQAYTIDTFANQAIPVGAFIYVVNQGAGKLTIAGAVGVTFDNAGITALVSGQACTIVHVATNEWAIIPGAKIPDVQTFTTTGSTQTWTKPAGVTAVRVWCQGGGGQGGSGRKGASLSARVGGGGGGGGGRNVMEFLASSLGATESVIVGIGGSTQTGQATDTSDGGAGQAGAFSGFGGTTLGNSKVVAGGGGGGGGGQSGAGGTAGSAGNGLINGGAGGAASATGGNGATGGTAGGAPGGGAGGGITTGDSASSGGNGSLPYSNTLGTAASGGAAGSVGSPGANNTDSTPGGSGGGGGASSGAGGKVGGTGGTYGAGGGGGGAAINTGDGTKASGAGGAGGQGIVVAVSV